MDRWILLEHGQDFRHLALGARGPLLDSMNAFAYYE